MTSFEAKSAEPIAPWKTGAVTLLGDAVHNMTPFRGHGRQYGVARRRRPSRSAGLDRPRPGRTERSPYGVYEREMIEQGFAAVNASLAEMRRLHARSEVSRFLSRLVYRTVDTGETPSKAIPGQAMSGHEEQFNEQVRHEKLCGNGVGTRQSR